MVGKIFNTDYKGRLAYFDNIKFLMIVLMFIGHFADNLKMPEMTDGILKSTYLVIYAFHMPVLLFISGLFYSAKNWKRKVVFYVCCGFALKIFLSLTDMLCDGTFRFRLLSDGRIPWFMFVLAAYQIIMRLLYKLNDRYKWILLLFFILLGCFVGYDQTIKNYLYLSRIVVFFPVFFAGTMLTPEKIEDFFRKNYKKILIPAILIIVFWFGICYFQVDLFYGMRQFLTGKNPFPESVRTIGPVIRLGCYIVTAFTGFSVMALIPKRRLPVISTLGTHTLNVYFWHWSVMLFFIHIAHIEPFYYAGPLQKIVCLLLAIALSFILAGVKVFNYPLAWLKKAIYYRP